MVLWTQAIFSSRGTNNSLRLRPNNIINWLPLQMQSDSEKKSLFLCNIAIAQISLSDMNKCLRDMVLMIITIITIIVVCSKIRVGNNCNYFKISFVYKGSEHTEHFEVAANGFFTIISSAICRT